MTISNSPLPSARSARASARQPDVFPGKEQRSTPLAHQSLPPLKITETDAPSSARGARPTLSSARSDVSNHSNKSIELSARVKTSPYAIPLQLKTPVASARNTSSAGSARVLPTPKLEIASDIPSETPTAQSARLVAPIKIDEPREIRIEDTATKEEALALPESLPHEDHEDATPSIDELLEKEGFHEESPCEAEVEEEESRPEPIEHELPAAGQPQESSVSIYEEQDTNVPEDQESQQALAGDDRSAHQSAISSIYCNNSTMIASIPEEMELTRTYDDERNVGAPSPAEPSPTPVDRTMEEANDDSVLRLSLNQALIDATDTPRRKSSMDEMKIVNVTSASPRLGVATPSPRGGVTQAHITKIEEKLKEEMQVQGGRDEVVVMAIASPRPATTRNKKSWSKMFCCGSKE